MKKYIGFVGILIGIFANIGIFGTIYSFFDLGNGIINDIFNNMLLMFGIEIIGILLSVFALLKYKEKILSSIGIILNAIPFIYCLILIVGLN